MPSDPRDRGRVRLFAPEETPRDVITEVNTDMVQVLAMPELKGALVAQGKRSPRVRPNTWPR